MYQIIDCGDTCLFYIASIVYVNNLALHREILMDAMPLLQRASVDRGPAVPSCPLLIIYRPSAVKIIDIFQSQLPT